MSHKQFLASVVIMTAVVATLITIMLGFYVTGLVETERAIVKFDYPR